MKHFLLSGSSIFILFISFLFSSCSKSDTSPKHSTTSLSITSISQNTGPFNTSIIIYGVGFSSTISNDRAFINGKAATITAASVTQLTVNIPLGAGTGDVSVSVNNSTAVSGPLFTYQLSAVVTTIAGSQTSGSTNGVGTAATFEALWGIVMDASNNLYVSDGLLIRKITPDSTVSTFAGNSLTFVNPASLAIDATGNIYVADVRSIRKVTPTGVVTTVAGSNYFNNSEFLGIVLDASGNIYASDIQNNVILKITPSGTSSIFAGSGIAGSANGTGTLASFNQPDGLGIDAAGNIYSADEGSNLIRKITPAGVVTTVAGNGTQGDADGSAGTSSFSSPTGVAVDATGNLYIGDFGNNKIRKITPDGTVSTLAGSGVLGYSDGVGTAATFVSPNDLCIDKSGNIYVANGRDVRKITME